MADWPMRWPDAPRRPRDEELDRYLVRRAPDEARRRDDWREHHLRWRELYFKPSSTDWHTELKAKYWPATIDMQNLRLSSRNGDLRWAST